MADASVGRDGVVRQMRMEVEGLHAFEPAASIEVAALDQRLKLSGSLDGGRTQSVLIVNRHTQPLHQRPGVLAEPLLTGHERVAVVRVFHGALLEIVRHADIVVRTENQARAFALEPLAHRFDFRRGRLLLGDQVIEAEHHQRVGIVENARVDRKLLPRLVDALVDGDRMSGLLANQLLETQQRQDGRVRACRRCPAGTSAPSTRASHRRARPRGALR